MSLRHLLYDLVNVLFDYRLRCDLIWVAVRFHGSSDRVLYSLRKLYVRLRILCRRRKLCVNARKMHMIRLFRMRRRLDRSLVLPLRRMRRLNCYCSLLRIPLPVLLVRRRISTINSRLSVVCDRRSLTCMRLNVRLVLLIRYKRLIWMRPVKLNRNRGSVSLGTNPLMTTRSAVRFAMLKFTASLLLTSLQLIHILTSWTLRISRTRRSLKVSRRKVIPQTTMSKVNSGLTRMHLVVPGSVYRLRCAK